MNAPDKNLLFEARLDDEPEFILIDEVLKCFHDTMPISFTDKFEAMLRDVVRNANRVRAVAPYSEETEQAMSYARLWRAGKLIGGDPYEVCDLLLAEVERLHALIDLQHQQGEHDA